MNQLIAMISRPAWLLRLLLAAMLAAMLALAGAASVASTAASAKSPEDQVRDVSDAVLALIEEARGYAEDDPERFYGEITTLLDPFVDFDSFARSVMAVHFRDATPAQRRRFSDSFKWGLVRTYALALTEFSNGKVTVLPADQGQRNPGRHTVRMEVVTPSGSVYPIQYTMGQNRQGEWQVRNIIVSGINMGLTYRNQFASAMNDPVNGGNLDKVIDGWSEMLAEEAAELESTLQQNDGGPQA